jgi:transposase
MGPTFASVDSRARCSCALIDTSIVRVHQHGACIAGNNEQLMGRSRGGLTTKIHAVVDTRGLPIRLALTTGEAHDNRLVLPLRSSLRSGAMLLADSGFDADWIRTFVTQRGAWANIRDETGRSQFALAATCIVHAIWSSVSSTRSSNVGVSRRAMISSQQITSPSFNWHPSGYGCALMSPRPNFMIVRAVPELVEVVHSAAKAHGLAVYDDRRNLEARDCFHDQRITLGVVVALFRLQSHHTTNAPRDNAEAVMFDFVNP